MSEISTRDAARDSTRDAVRDNARDSAMSVAAISLERAESDDNVWTRRLVLFLRVMALLSILKGLYHWAQVTGFVGGEDEAFENQSMAWQASTIYFAVIELVAAVGLWLATPWGAAVWLTTPVLTRVINSARSAGRTAKRSIELPDALSAAGTSVVSQLAAAFGSPLCRATCSK